MADKPKDPVVVDHAREDDEHGKGTEGQKAHGYNPYMQVPPMIANETNDFVDESILFLHLSHKKKTNSKQWMSYLPTLNSSDAKHLILYDWIALSLVREAHADVAAVAAYTSPEQPSRVYYAKNNLNSLDEAHANEFADLVRLAASNGMPFHEFQTQYFILMHKNCLPKLKRRVDQLRASLSFCGKPLKDENNEFIYTPSQSDQLRTLLQNAIESNAWQPRRRNRADTESLALVKSTKNIFVALLKLFDSMKIHITSDETADMLEILSIHCWLIGRSGILAELARDKFGVQEVIDKAAKFGDYIRGTAHLYLLVGNEKTRMSLQSFEVFAVPPMPDRRVELDKDWFHVIETVYHRINGNAIDIDRNKMFSPLQAQVMAYAKFDGKFIRHAEIQLIEYLMSQQYPPALIGISKLSCALCDQWIKAMNDKTLVKWKVGGCHGRIYPWARDVNAGPMTADAEARVKAFVHHELVDLVGKFIPDAGESPPHTLVFDVNICSTENPKMSCLDFSA